MSSNFSTYRIATKHSPTWHYQQRCRKRDRRHGYAGYPIRVDQIGDRDALYQAYKSIVSEGGPAAGIDNVRPADLSPSEAGDLAGALSRRIIAGTYLPSPTLPVPIPKPGTTERRILSIPATGDRMVGRALHDAFTEVWDKIFLRCSYGFRRGCNTWQLLADLETAITRLDRWVLAIDDIRRAYDNVPISAVIDAHARHLAAITQDNFGDDHRQRTLHFIDAVLRGYDQDTQVGIAQGGPYSPTALNVLLHDTLDVPMMAHVDNKPLWYRYADNLVVLAGSVTEGRHALATVSTLLQPLGLTLKGDGDGVIDLSAGDSAQLLGYRVYRDDDEVRFRIGDTAWDNLRQSLSDAHAEVDPPETALKAVLGWVEYLGPAYEYGDVSQVSDTAAEYGFREIPGDVLETRWQASWHRWQGCLRRSHDRWRV